MPGVPPLPGGLSPAVAEVFAPDGPLSRALESFEPRPGQRQMAEAVAEVLERGGVLLAEAGTGTGKTLAYLVPALLCGRRILVSTGTKNLQEQIFLKDLPLLREVLDRPVSATCMKGRGNYLCLHRFDALRHSPRVLAATDRVALTLVEEWSAGTVTGDRAEIDELPDDSPLWSEIAATTDTCLGSTCPRFDECFVTRMRRRALESDLVVVNHHLLCADAAVRYHSFGEVIPERDFAIVDEAHQLEDVATQYFGLAVSTWRLEELARDGDALLAAGAVPDRPQAATLRARLASVREAAGRFFDRLLAARPPSAPRAPAGPGLFDERVRLTDDLVRAMGETGAALAGDLDALESAAAVVRDATEDVRGLARRAAELRGDLAFLLAAGDPAFVYFLELRGRGVFLRAMPVDVSSIVRELLLDRMQATVLTSATLSVGGSFAYVRARLGIGQAVELQLPSEFDFRRQSVLYLPPAMPDPRSPAFGARAAEEIAAVLERTEGRAFVLFTSYAGLRDAQARLAGRLPYPLLVQGEAPRSVLLDDFRRTPNAVLLATASFWQGVDVAGEALSCVIIDKLPFASPGDPVVQARIEAIEARGGSAFDEYQVPLAILTLLQGLGRLLRHRSDRGVLAVLDPRLRTMGYGRRFLAALPPSPITHRLDDIGAFFAHD